MEKIFKIANISLAFVWVNMMFGQSLNIYQRDGILVEPTHYLQLKFPGDISVADAHQSKILDSEGNIVAHSTEFRSFNMDGSGYIDYQFDVDYLPIGCNYTLRIEDAEVRNTDTDEYYTQMDFPFVVPSDLGEGTVRWKDSYAEDGFSFIFVSFDYEVDPYENPAWEVYRNGVFIRKLDTKVSWDWDYGQISGFFWGFSRELYGKIAKFENGVDFKLRLPEKSGIFTGRKDLFTREVVKEFTGRCPDPVPPVVPASSRLVFSNDGNILTSAVYEFETQVLLTGAPKATLMKGVQEIAVFTPVINEVDGKWIVSVDLGGYDIEGESVDVVLAESSVAAATGDISVNRDIVMNTSATGADAVFHDAGPQVEIIDGVISVSGLENGAEVSLLRVDGLTVNSATAYGGNVAFPVPASGIYLLFTGNRTLKIRI